MYRGIKGANGMPKEIFSEVRPLRGNRRVLQQATRHAHDQAEDSWGFMGHDAFAMGKFLQAMLNLHISFGLPAALRLGQAHLLDRETARLAALRCDLKIPSKTPVPVARPWRRADEAWGILYALNGSAMGATALLRTQGGEGRPQAYLSLMQDYAQSGALGAFFRDLNRQTLDQAAAIAGARSVFDAMTQREKAA